MRWLTLLTALTSLSASQCYDILFVGAVPSNSHANLCRGVIKALLKAGHQVTWATAFPEQKPLANLTLIGVSEVHEIAGNMNMMGGDVSMADLMPFFHNTSEATARNPALQAAIRSKQYDAVITEYFMSDLFSGFAAVQQVPWLTFFGMGMTPDLEYLVDEIRTLSTIPIMVNISPVPMSFVQRVKNNAMFSVWWFLQTINYGLTRTAYEDIFAPLAAARNVPLPSLEEASHNISILFLNTHPSFSPAQVLPPNVVEIAGYHIDEEIPPLPKDLQQLLDSSPQGVVYFSMGSVLKGSALPEETKRFLIKTFSELPYTVLWKYEDPIEGLPKNVIAKPWWPQPSILQHPNVRLFITHGGLLSTLEALRSGVPLLALPVFGDQPSNAARAQNDGYARAVPLAQLTEANLRDALKEMLGKDSYQKKAKYLSKLFNSRPVAPSKLINYYVELAIETKGAVHLRSKSLLYPWYQRWMLDQLLAALAALCALRTIAHKLFRLCFRKKTDSKIKQKRS